jgi:predicted MFS family arabinose efflux permease
MGIVGASALSIIDEVGLGESFVGALVGAFFLMGSATAALAGRRIDAVGARRAALMAGAVTAFVALPTLATASDPYLMLLGCAVAGAAFAITLPATNAVLRPVVPAKRIVLAVCIKQAAIPLSLVLAATIAPTLGRSAAFALADVMAVVSLVAFWVRSGRAGAPSSGLASVSPEDQGSVGIARYAWATLLASLLAGALLGYSAVTLERVGLSASSIAGVLLVGNLGGIATRVLSGALMQRLNFVSWWPVTVLMIAGGAGALCMTSSRPIVAVVGCLTAFALGWGWSGLTFALVLVGSGSSPGASGATVQAAGMLGSALGPVLMGFFVTNFGYTAGWLVIGSALSLAGMLVAPRSRVRVRSG